MELQIKLFNRDGFKVWLEKTEEDGWWRLENELPDYTRLLFEEDGSIYAVDPPGGPFVMIGYKVRGMIVEDIQLIEGKEVLIKLKPETLIYDEI